MIGEISMMFSNADNSLQGLDLPEHFVFTGSFQRMVEPFLGDNA